MDDPSLLAKKFAAVLPHLNERQRRLLLAAEAQSLGRGGITQVARAAGAREVHAITWPGNRRSVAFHRSLGFVPEEGPGTQILYGTAAMAGYDYGAEDRVLLVREL